MQDKDEIAIRKSKFLVNIDSSIQELLKTHIRTANPKPIPHQYIGTAIDSFICLLCSAANSIDPKCNNNFGLYRNIVYEDFNNWLSVIQIIHRTFFNIIHSCLEVSLKEYLLEKNIAPESSLIEKYQKIINEATFKENRQKKKISNYFKRKKPTLEDYINSTLLYSNISDERKTLWRKFFKAFNIIRNKGSHSDATLSGEEVKILQDGGFSALVKEGTLQINCLYYSQTANFILDFLDEVTPPNSKENEII
ncbi:MAG: hypothetical protein SFT90_04625 [Rickettsiales bacterium]|nr:hypothetical protein [Rickettsiales bacterium]